MLNILGKNPYLKVVGSNSSLTLICLAHMSSKAQKKNVVELLVIERTPNITSKDVDDANDLKKTEIKNRR